ncbi:MAG: helix-turn-helix transcriptional regulator [Bryobacteraceae bacterium]|nr:helix-turn-helix transcriptional regulator [Bryobacteraceae bacterium]
MARVDERDELRAIAHAIRTVRETLGETQTQFARRFGVSRNTIACWEGAAKVPVVGTLMHLADLAKQHSLDFEHHTLHSAYVHRDADAMTQAVWQLRETLQDVMILHARLPLEQILEAKPELEEGFRAIGKKLSSAAALTDILDPTVAYRWQLVAAAREKQQRRKGLD